MSKCKLCGGEMIVDTSVVLTSLPAKYVAKYSKCGDIQYIKCLDNVETKIIISENEQQLKLIETTALALIKYIDTTRDVSCWLRDNGIGLFEKKCPECKQKDQRIAELEKQLAIRNKALELSLMKEYWLEQAEEALKQLEGK